MPPERLVSVSQADAVPLEVQSSAEPLLPARRMCECGVLPHTNLCSWAYPNEPKVTTAAPAASRV